MRINIDLSGLPDLINTKYYPLLENMDRYLVLYGSAGSGKSHFIAQKWLVRILMGIKKGKRHKYLALRKTQPAVRKSVFALIKHYCYSWGLRDLVKINKQDMTFSFIGGSEILCGGLDDPEKLKSIEGVTGVWLEEATEFTKEDFTQVDLRIRGASDSYKQICLSFNPISRLNWAYERFFAQKTENCTVVHSTYKDNRFLDDDYRRVLEDLQNQDKTLYDIYALGQWGELKGLVYTNWDMVDEFPDNCDEIIYGLDFGFNHPTAVIKIGIKDKLDVYLHEELYQTRLTNTDLIGRLEDIVTDKNCLIKADSAEPDRIEEIHRAGFYILPARKGKNSVKDGIDVVKRFRLHITKSSTNIKKEAQSYKWKEDKDGNPLDVPVDAFNHALDSVRYGIGDGEGDDVFAWDI